MNTRRLLSLIGALALATVAVAIPALAEEATQVGWTMEGKAETKAREIGFSGSAEFAPEAGSGTGCTVEGKVTANSKGEPAGTGVFHLRLIGESCEGFGGFATCKLEKIGGTDAEGTRNFPYHLFTTKPSKTRVLVVTNAELNPLYNTGCPGGREVTLKFPQLVATPNNAEAIKSLTIKGEGTSIIDGVEKGPSTTAGTLSITGESEGKPNAGTFGIEL